jgi:hypothetical protein
MSPTLAVPSRHAGYRTVRPSLICSGLQTVELGVERLAPHEVGVAGLFRDAALVEHDDEMGRFALLTVAGRELAAQAPDLAAQPSQLLPQAPDLLLERLCLGRPRRSEHRRRELEGWPRRRKRRRSAPRRGLQA